MMNRLLIVILVIVSLPQLANAQDSYSSACSTTVTFTFKSGVTDAQRTLIIDRTKNAVDYICRKTGYGVQSFIVIASPNYQDLIEAQVQLGYSRAQSIIDWAGSANCGGATSPVGGILIDTHSPSCVGFDQPDLSGITGTIAHEYFHQIQRRLAGINSANDDSVPHRGPSWLLEGAAQLVFNMAVDEANLTKDRGFVAGESQAISLDPYLLSSQENGLNNSGSVGGYGYASAVVDRLTGNAPWKLNLLMSFWANIGKGSSWPQAFQDTFGITLEDFYSQFEQYHASISGVSLTYVGSPGIGTFGESRASSVPYLFYVSGINNFLGAYTRSQLDSIIQLPSGNNGWDGPIGIVVRVYMLLSAPSGPAALTLRLPDGRQASASFQVIQPPSGSLPTPVINSVSPISPVQGGIGLNCDVTGHGFIPGSTATINGVATPTYVTSDSHLQVYVSGKNLLAPMSIVISNSSVVSSTWTLVPSDPHIITAQTTGSSFGASGGSGSIDVSAASNIFWAASSSSSWMTINKTGIGNGTVSYTLSPNIDAASRTGLINIGGVYVTVSQAGDSTSAAEVFRSFTLANPGGTSLMTQGGAADTKVGYGRLQADGGSSTPAGIAIYGLRENNVLITETSVPASPLIRSGRIYAEVFGTVNTGIAVVNPNSQQATLSFYFTDRTGTNYGSGTTVIPANGQIAKFLNESPFNSGSSVQGTFTFNSSIPVSVVALRGLTNERSEFLITTLPVADLGIGAGTGTVIFPHFADGGGWTTRVVLVNPTDVALTGAVQFLNAAGTAATVTVNIQSSSTFAYSIPARSSLTLPTSGTLTSTLSGSVRAVPASNTAAPSGLAIFSLRNAGKTVTEAGVPSRPAGTAFRMYVETAGIPTSVGSIQTGFAITNISANTATVSLELNKLDGSSTALTGTLSIPPNGQVAAFLSEVPGFASLEAPFQGVLRVSSTESLSVVGLRGRYNERGDFLVTTTTATAENATVSSADLFFPHFVDSGGYTTQFVLFAGSAGQPSSGNLRFYSQTGQPLALILSAP